MPVMRVRTWLPRGRFSVISGFEAAYSAYHGFQQGIERFWTLRWLAQNAVTELDASVMKDGLVRADTLPLVFRVVGTENLPRGSHVRTRITGMDLLTLELHASLAARLEAPTEPTADDAADGAEDDELDAAGTLQLAIAVDEAGTSGDEPALPAALG